MTNRMPKETDSADRGPVTFEAVPRISRPEDLFSIASAMENAAAARYAELAERMRSLGEEDLATLFRRLENEEKAHGTVIAQWMAREGVTREETPPPRTEHAEAPRESAPTDMDRGLTTPWRVLDTALGHEERAFAFYARVAAKTSDGATRRLAEDLASEELSHVALLRLARLRAWPGEKARSATHLPPEGPPPTDGDAERLAAYAAKVEAATAERLEAAAAHAPPALADLLENLAAEARIAAGHRSRPGPSSRDPAARPDPTVPRAEALRADRLYEAWIKVIDTATDPDAVSVAQRQARTCLSRYLALRDTLPEGGPSKD